MCSVLLIIVCPFVLFLLTIMLSVPLWLTDSDYPFVSSMSYYTYVCGEWKPSLKKVRAVWRYQCQISEAVNTLANRKMTTHSGVVQKAANTNLIVSRSFIFRASMIPITPLRWLIAFKKFVFEQRVARIVWLLHHTIINHFFFVNIDQERVWMNLCCVTMK